MHTSKRINRILTVLILATMLLPPAAASADGGWHIETVDSTGNVGYDTSLALDRSGRPHISYYDKTNGDLKYAWHDGTTWQIETVDSTGNVGWHTSLALDGSGRPHISYYDETNYDLKYAWYNGADWQIETVDNTWGWDTSLALDETGRPHISYYAANNLKYAWHDGAAWQIETVDSGGNWEISLALDGSGRPHISYWSGGGLKYAWHDGMAWQIETVDSTGGDMFLSTSLALDEVGRPHISYGYSDDIMSDDALKYAWHDGMAWQIETLDSTVGIGWYASLALDGLDRPHISYCSGGGLKYAWHDGTAWQIETVDSTGNVSWHTSLALDGSGRPHISYYDRTNFDLKYAWNGFRPNPDGYSFSNFDYYGADWEQFKAAFPDSDVEFYGFPRPLAWLFFNNTYRTIGEGGNCYGFSGSSLVRFTNHSETVEDDLLTPEHNALPHVHDMPEVVSGDVGPGQSDVKDYIHLYQARQKNSNHVTWLRAHGSDTPLDSYQAIKAALADFQNTPVIVGISNVGGKGAHAMVPYRVEETGNTAKIYVYDNESHDDVNRAITINLTTGAWSYTYKSGSTWGDPTGNEGLLALPLSLSFPSQLPSGGNILLSLVFGGDEGDLLISDSLGRGLGYRNGQMVSEIPDAVYMPVMGFDPDNPEPLEQYSLPPGDYRIEAQGVANGVYTITMSTGDVGLSLAGLTTSISQTNVISVTSGLTGTQFRPAEEVQNHCFTHAAEFTSTESGRTFELCTSTSAGDVASFEVISDSAEFRYHNGGQPTTYTLCVQDMGASAAVCESGSLGSGETFTWTEKNIYLPIICTVS